MALLRWPRSLIARILLVEAGAIVVAALLLPALMVWLLRAQVDPLRADRRGDAEGRRVARHRHPGRDRARRDHRRCRARFPDPLRADPAADPAAATLDQLLPDPPAGDRSPRGERARRGDRPRDAR